MTVESLKFKIGLSGTFWNKRPAFTIAINEKQVAEGSITEEENKIQYIEFTADVVDETENTLTIRLENKEPTDTVQNEDKTAIIKDMLLNIESIEIDDISLGTLLWSASKFIPDDDQFPVTEKCVNLGWTGSYTITFNSPFYLWLLENM